MAAQATLRIKRGGASQGIGMGIVTGQARKCATFPETHTGHQPDWLKADGCRIGRFRRRGVRIGRPMTFGADLDGLSGGKAARVEHGPSDGGGIGAAGGVDMRAAGTMAALAGDAGLGIGKLRSSNRFPDIGGMAIEAAIDGMRRLHDPECGGRREAAVLRMTDGDPGTAGGGVEGDPVLEIACAGAAHGRHALRARTENPLNHRGSGDSVAPRHHAQSFGIG